MAKRSTDFLITAKPGTAAARRFFDAIWPEHSKRQAAARQRRIETCARLIAAGANFEPFRNVEAEARALLKEKANG